LSSRLRVPRRGQTADASHEEVGTRGERWAWWALLVGNTVAMVSAMTYDKTVNAIGPFELSEYLGLAIVWGALAVTAPVGAAGPQARATGRHVSARIGVEFAVVVAAEDEHREHASEGNPIPCCKCRR
jgi:hypothetical protein